MAPGGLLKLGLHITRAPSLIPIHNLHTIVVDKGCWCQQITVHKSSLVHVLYRIRRAPLQVRL